MMVNVSKEWVAQQAAKAAAPVKEGWKDGALTVFCPGRPTHPLNGTLAHAHWSKRAKWAKGWRERAAHQVLIEMNTVFGGLPWKSRTPKHITFIVCGAARFDDDNLRAVCKPVRDSLKDMAVIDDDRPSSGHVFEYRQEKPSRKAGAVHGIAVRIALRGVE